MILALLVAILALKLSKREEGVLALAFSGVDPWATHDPKPACSLGLLGIDRAAVPRGRAETRRATGEETGPELAAESTGVLPELLEETGGWTGVTPSEPVHWPKGPWQPLSGRQ